MQWLNRHAIQKAKVLLRYSDLPIWEVAERMKMQIQNAREWRDVTNTFFHRLSGAEDNQGRTIYDWCSDNVLTTQLCYAKMNIQGKGW